MSSVYVRDQIKLFLTQNSPEKVIDLTGEYDNIQDLVAKNGLSRTDDWVGLQFLGSDEEPVTVGSTNVQGKYREFGSVYFHVVGKAKVGVVATILTRSEDLRDLLRGRRIGDIVVESITPPVTGAGASLNFEGGYTSASFILSYHRDLDL